MKKQFSLVYLTTPGCSPPETIYMAARAGFDFVSLRTIPMRLPTEPALSLADDKQLLVQTKRALEGTGIKLHDTENARILDGVKIKEYAREMEIAADLGARYILTNIWTSDRPLIIESLCELCDLANSYGLGVMVEFVTWSSVKTINEVRELLREVKRENAGIIVDTLHFNRSRCSLVDLENASDLVRFVHICDAPREIPTTKDDLIHAGRAERLYPGDGGIDLAEIIKRLPPIVYGIELPNLKLAEEIGDAEHVFRALEKTKSYFEQHQL
jgi:sugar phosphate isomerase/epimerase